MRMTARRQELAGANKPDDLTPPPRTTESEGWPIAPFRHQTHPRTRRNVS